jgi:hypothetical protein
LNHQMLILHVINFKFFKTSENAFNLIQFISMIHSKPLTIQNNLSSNTFVDVFGCCACWLLFAASAAATATIALNCGLRWCLVVALNSCLCWRLVVTLDGCSSRLKRDALQSLLDPWNLVKSRS